MASKLKVSKGQRRSLAVPTPYQRRIHAVVSQTYRTKALKIIFINHYKSYNYRKSYAKMTPPFTLTCYKIIYYIKQAPSNEGRTCLLPPRGCVTMVKTPLFVILNEVKNLIYQ